MKVLEGTPQEIAEYQATQAPPGNGSALDITAQPVLKPSKAKKPAQEAAAAPAPSTADEVAEEMVDTFAEEVEDTEDEAMGRNWLTVQYVIFSRSWNPNRIQANPAQVRRVRRYLDNCLAQLDDVWVTYGTGKGSEDGLANYVLLRDARTAKYGALAYIWPRTGIVRFRLKWAEINEAVQKSGRVRGLSVAASDPYAVSMTLNDEDDLMLAFQLAGLALEKVRNP